MNPAGPATGGKLLRLRCRFRPLHDTYIKDGNIVEDDADVIFICGDGHQLRAHKVIMASSSKFFAKLFEDQASVTAVVSVPDIKVDIMKHVLQLTYRDRVILTIKQIKEVGEFMTIFGMAWAQFVYEEYQGDEQMTSLPKASIPMKPGELPRTIIYVSRNPPQQRQSGGSPQQLSTIHQNQQNDVNSSRFHPQQGSSNSRMSQMQMQNKRQSSRKTKLTPRVGIEDEEIVEQYEEEDPENKMRDWLARLGKRDSTSISPNAPIAKRMRADPQVVRTGNGPEPQGGVQNGYSCKICNGRFRSELAWRLHEDRHVGVSIYKCLFCDELVSTLQLCYNHEKEAHGYSGMKLAGAQQQQQASNAGSAGNVAQQRRVFVHPKQQSKLGGVSKGNAAAHSSKIKMAASENPTSFHEHLTLNAEGVSHCGKNSKPVEEADSPPVLVPQPKPAPKNAVKRPKTTTARRPKRVESPIESKATYKVQFHTPPKSARLANRAKAEASAEAEKAKAKQTNISFPSVDCPVCGDGEIPNISQHLQDKHKELKIGVTRISSDLLQCKNCAITFSICELLNHKNCFAKHVPANAVI